MKLLTLDQWIDRCLSFIVVLIIVVIPFHALLTVWGSTFVSHYTLLRLWKEGLLLIALGLLGYQLHHRSVRQLFRTNRLTWLLGSYVVLELVTGIIAFHRHTVNLKALGYGLIINLRFMGFFVVALVSAERINLRRHIWRWLLGPALIVVVFGFIQHAILPADSLRHVGYSSTTIPAYETVDANQAYVRVQSTLRGPNPLGAYLVVVLSALAVRWQLRRRQWVWPAGILVSLIVLDYTYSRSAWIGSGLALLFIGALAIPVRRRKLASLIGIIVCLVGLGFGGLMRHNLRFENIFFHTDSTSRATVSSNTAHASALESGLHEVVHEPFGRGPGTAGPASVYNNHPAQIAENYYIQVAQEVGWLGLLIFLGIIG
jgi:hypothetical protein